ncbi:MAG: hypothetical protein ACREPM_16905, partial [Gemmatimonadaceae bacterium]
GHSMDLYITSLLLGVAGLGTMAVSGLGARGGGHAPAGHGHAHGQSHAGHATRGGAGRILSLMSPRVLFSLALGFGASGLLLRPAVGEPLLIVGAALGAVLFDRVLVSPLWNFSMRFASKPAATLESAVSDEATAVTAFDTNGEGIVSVEVDGQIVQILATLQPNDRLLGTRVRAGQKVRIEDVNTEKNCCTVSII